MSAHFKAFIGPPLDGIKPLLLFSVSGERLQKKEIGVEKFPSIFVICFGPFFNFFFLVFTCFTLKFYRCEFINLLRYQYNVPTVGFKMRTPIFALRERFEIDS